MGLKMEDIMLRNEAVDNRPSFFPRQGPFEFSIWGLLSPNRILTQLKSLTFFA